MAEKQLEKIIEALLFTSDKPVPVNTLVEVLGATHKEVEEAVDRLSIHLKESDSPVSIREIGGGYELLTLPDYAPFIKKLYKNKLLARLSRPSLEVLAIIAYKQPITKQEVELIRGVNSDGVYHTLLERNLVKIAGRKDSPGRPLLYGTTKEFLQYLGINSMEELPKIEEIKTILEKEENIENWDDRVEKVKNQTVFDFDEPGKAQTEAQPQEQTSTDQAGTEQAETEQASTEQAEGEPEPATDSQNSTDSGDNGTGGNDGGAV